MVLTLLLSEFLIWRVLMEYGTGNDDVVFEVGCERVNALL